VLLWTRWWTFGFCRGLRISWQAKRLLGPEFQMACVVQYNLKMDFRVYMLGNVKLFHTESRIITVLVFILTSIIPFKSKTLETISAPLKTAMMMLVTPTAKGKNLKLPLWHCASYTILFLRLLGCSSEDGHSMLLRNVDIYPHFYMA
jgi:hypothetical protein